MATIVGQPPAPRVPVRDHGLLFQLWIYSSPWLVLDALESILKPVTWTHTHIHARAHAHGITPRTSPSQVVELSDVCSMATDVSAGACCASLADLGVSVRLRTPKSGCW